MWLRSYVSTRISPSYLKFPPIRLYQASTIHRHRISGSMHATGSATHNARCSFVFHAFEHACAAADDEHNGSL